MHGICQTACYGINIHCIILVDIIKVIFKYKEERFSKVKYSFQITQLISYRIRIQALSNSKAYALVCLLKAAPEGEVNNSEGQNAWRLHKAGGISAWTLLNNHLQTVQDYAYFSGYFTFTTCLWAYVCNWSLDFSC